jgi:hypothetical protein
MLRMVRVSARTALNMPIKATGFLEAEKKVELSKLKL